MKGTVEKQSIHPLSNNEMWCHSGKLTRVGARGWEGVQLGLSDARAARCEQVGAGCM